MRIESLVAWEFHDSGYGDHRDVRREAAVYRLDVTGCLLLLLVVAVCFEVHVADDEGMQRQYSSPLQVFSFFCLRFLSGFKAR
jgi:hypothetical protein